jgi:hypothetical protein
MTRTPTADIPTADLVRRTLQAVADAVPVDDRPAADRLVVQLAPSIPTAATPGPNRWRRGRRSAAAVLGAAAALVVAVLAVQAGGDGNEAGPATDLSDPASVQFVPDWLPDDVTIEVGLVGRVSGIELALDAALLRSPDGTGDVLVAALERSDGRPIGEQQVRKVRNAIDTPTARLEDSGAEGRDGSRGWVAVSRGSASRDDALAAGAALMDAAVPIDSTDPADPADWADVLPGWTPQPVPLGWLPDFAPTYRTRYAGDDRSVDVLTVVGDLPPADVLPTLLVDARTVTVRGQQGWISSLPSAGSDMLVWREAPGLVGAVIATELSSDELVQVADGLRVAEQPAGDADVEVVAGGDVEGMAYRIERQDTRSEGRCVTLYVDDVATGPSCGLDPPDGTVRQIGPVERNDDVTLVWGILAADVHEATVGPFATVRAPALPVDPDDPASLRYVLLALPHQSSPVDITLSDAEGHALAVTTVDLQGTIGG